MKLSDLYHIHIRTLNGLFVLQTKYNRAKTRKSRAEQEVLQDKIENCNEHIITEKHRWIYKRPFQSTGYIRHSSLNESLIA